MENKDDIESILAAVAAGEELGGEQEQQFLAALRGDPALVERFGSQVTIARLLPLALGRKTNTFAEDTIAEIAAESDSPERAAFVPAVLGKIRRRRIMKLALMAAAVVALIIGLSVLFSKAGTVVEIVRIESSGWQPAERELAVGGRVIIEDGLVELHYRSGVTVVLNAPADFEITGANRGFLHRGRLVAEIDSEGGKGYTIDGPSGRLVDLGTAFGVSVDAAGEMEVHVLEGAVEVAPTGGGKTLLLENQAMRLVAGGGEPLMKADESAFITQMPPESDALPQFVRWSFDEQTGDSSGDSGRLLGAGNAVAIFKTDSGGGDGPRRIAGKYGQAIHLDGASYLESKFQGIAHSSPRTIAFWVRVPKDFGKREGFGVVNWGSYEKRGAAWQIAINSLVADGPVGRLRIGTNGGEVVGTSDLRDGQWHHCAVVLYGERDGKPNTATHILLYVDGRIENAARKSVRVIDTLPKAEGESGHPGVWIGRNMGYSRYYNGGWHGKYFRGDLDELIICNTALSQMEIQALMNDNSMP